MTVNDLVHKWPPSVHLKFHYRVHKIPILNPPRTARSHFTPPSPIHISFHPYIGLQSGWAPEPVWTLQRWQKHPSSAGNLIGIPQSSNPKPSHYTTELSRLSKQQGLFTRRSFYMAIQWQMLNINSVKPVVKSLAVPPKTHFHCNVHTRT